MTLDRWEAYEQGVGNFPIGCANRHQAQHLDFAPGQGNTIRLDSGRIQRP